MTKKRALLFGMLFTLLLLLCVSAGADSNPITAKIEINPDKLAQPGPVEVTISVTNTGSTDMTEPITLFDPAAKQVEDFGNGGQCLLAAGQTETWTGTYNVSQNTLDNGAVTYFLKYKLQNDAGEWKEDKQVLRAAVSRQTEETDISVKRTISSTVAGEGQDIEVKYEIKNTGTVALTNITIEENKAVYKEKQKIDVLNPGATAVLTYPVTMGKQDIVSGAKITYTSETQKKKQTYTVENQTIRYGTSKLTAELTSSSKGVVENGSVTLILKLKNSGTMNYSDIRVTDDKLGNLFVDDLTGKELAAGKNLTLEQEITVPETAEYRFTVTATDDTGKQESIATDALTITAIRAQDALNLQVNITADRTEVFSTPGNVRFTIEIINDSQVDASNVVLKHGSTTICNLGSIPAGKKRVLSRDTALSMAGKYQFTVTAKDPLENQLIFASNAIQIVFSRPTPVPATPTPPPVATPEPVFQPATIPPVTDDSIGSMPKMLSRILAAIAWVAGILMVGSIGLIIAVKVHKLRNAQAVENACDTMNVVLPRNYLSPDEPEEVPVQGQNDINNAENASTGYGEGITEDGQSLEAGQVSRGDKDFVSRYNDDEYDLQDFEQQAASLRADTDKDDDLWNQWGEESAKDAASSSLERKLDSFSESFPETEVVNDANWQRAIAENKNDQEPSLTRYEMREMFEQPAPNAADESKPRRRRSQNS